MPSTSRDNRVIICHLRVYTSRLEIEEIKINDKNTIALAAIAMGIHLEPQRKWDMMQRHLRDAWLYDGPLQRTPLFGVVVRRFGPEYADGVAEKSASAYIDDMAELAKADYPGTIRELVRTMRKEGA